MIQITAEQILADISRLNGGKSNGPVTPEGKARSSRNAVKNGLSGKRNILLDSEDPKEYEAFRKATLSALAPKDSVQASLAERIVENTWRLRRIPIIERSILNSDKRIEQALNYGDGPARFSALGRYEATLERSIYQALNALSILQTQKIQNEPSQKCIIQVQNPPELSPSDPKNEPRFE